MHTMTIKNIRDDFYPHFKAIIQSLASERKLDYEEEEHDQENSYPPELVLSSVEEVKRRVYEAEKEPSMTQEEYDQDMDDFFENELGIKRR